MSDILTGMFFLSFFGSFRLLGLGSTQNSHKYEAFYFSNPPFAVQQRGGKVVQRFGLFELIKIVFIHIRNSEI